MFIMVDKLARELKSPLVHQLLKIHDTTRSIVEFAYIDPSYGIDGRPHYKWLWTQFLKDRSTRGSNKILWTVTNTESSVTILQG